MKDFKQMEYCIQEFIPINSFGITQQLQPIPVYYILNHMNNYSVFPLNSLLTQT